MEEPLQAVVARVTGDKGNPYYATELDQTAAQAKLDTQIVSPQKGAVEVTEEPIVVQASGVTGDKGNPHYAAELDKAGRESVIEAQIMQTTSAQPGKPTKKTGNIESFIQPAQTNVTGDKGNPYYAAELDKVGQESVIEAQIMQTTSAQPGKPTKKTGNIESLIQLAQANVTGDKGNPYYTAKLDKAGQESVIEAQIMQTTSVQPGKPTKKTDIIESLIQPAQAYLTGDKGNPYYKAELDKSAAAKTMPPSNQKSSDKGKIIWAYK